MRVIASFAVAFALVTAAAVAGQPEPVISGQYVEVRTCDVYTGPCFANAEVNITGEEAIMTWSVDNGTWKGVDLKGLNVIAVVKAQATLGDQDKSPYPAKAVVIVDAKADPAQKEALADLAKEMGGKLIEDVVRVESAEIATKFDECSQEGCATVSAKGLVQVSARCLHEGDKVCHNERAYYPPLTDVAGAMPHFAMENAYSGDALGTTWKDSDARSAYIGTFQK